MVDRIWRSVRTRSITPRDGRMIGTSSSAVQRVEVAEQGFDHRGLESVVQPRSRTWVVANARSAPSATPIARQDLEAGSDRPASIRARCDLWTPTTSASCADGHASLSRSRRISSPFWSQKRRNRRAVSRATSVRVIAMGHGTKCHCTVTYQARSGVAWQATNCARRRVAAVRSDDARSHSSRSSRRSGSREALGPGVRRRSHELSRGRRRRRSRREAVAPDSAAARRGRRR